MTLTKLTIIALSAAAVVFSGCSTDNRITGSANDFNPQIDNKLAELNPVTPDPNPTARVAIGNDDSDMHRQLFTIVAKVEMLDVENGCWYLKTNDGKTYTPLTPKGLTLKSGLSLKAEGYIDRDIQFFCGNGPAFVIENYEILSEPKDSDDDSENDRYSGIKTGDDSFESVTDNDNVSEDRDPSLESEDSAPQDQMERENDEKKKYEEEKRRRDRDTERP